jgi:hypothetical protein
VRGLGFAGGRVRARARGPIGILLIAALASAYALARPLGAGAEGSESDLTVTGRAAESPPDDASSGLPPEDVALDRLLQLPTTMRFDSESRQGASEAEWRTRFRESLAEIRTADDSLQRSRNELEAASGGGGGSWQMAPPGSSSTENSPVSFKLREDIRRGKDQVDETQRKHRELEVQADLADVPLSWRDGA